MTTTAIISHSHETPSSFFSSKPRAIQRGVSVAKGNIDGSSKENTFQTKTVTSHAYLLPKPVISTNNATGFSKAARNTPKSFIISKKSEVKLRTDGLTAANKLNPIKPKYSTQALSTETKESSKADEKKLPFRGGLSLERTNLRQRAASNAETGMKASTSGRRVSNGSKLIPVTQITKTTSLVKQTGAIKFGREALKALENDETRTNESPASDNSSFQAHLSTNKNNAAGAAGQLAFGADEVRQGSSSSQIFRIKSAKSRDLIRVNQAKSHSETSEKDPVDASSPLNKISTPGTLNNLDLKKEESNKSDENSPVLESSAEPAKLSLVKTTSSKNSNVPRGLVGLRNIGNTCFMNSILQCLFNTPGLFDYFLQGTHKKEKNPRNKGLADAFAELLGKIKSHVGAPSHSAESTHDVKNRISRINPMFSGYSQHDAQEFLKAILEGINDDVNRVVTKPPYKELTADPKRKIQDISDEWYNYMLARDNSIITDLFCGQLLSKITCTHCNNESLAFDNFWDLALSFSKSSSGKTHLSEMLEQFLKEEALEDLFHCENCKVRRKSKKRFVIWRLPKVLVVQLKRFEYTQYRRDKINKTVTFPVSNFDLSKFTQESTDASVRDCKYTLIGTVNHGGSLSGGHYTAECMNTDNRKWYNFNDSSVRETSMSKDESESSSPYILFYVKSSCLNE